MAVPDFQSFMLPMLRLADDNKEHSIGDATEVLVLHFGLNDEDKKEMLPSGRQTKIHNRISWCRTYLKKAGLLESTGRAKFRITQLGHDVLQKKPSRIDVNFLKQFPGFLKFHKGTLGDIDLTKNTVENSKTPEEVLEASYQELNKNLAEELLDRMKSCSPEFFERIVVKLLLEMGYGGALKDAGEIIGQPGDGGIDGIIKEDKLGLDSVYIQAKRWNGTVGSPELHGFAGSLMGKGAGKGVIITTSQFSKEAKEYAKTLHNPKIVMVDGELLAQLMIEYGIGVNDIGRYIVKRVDLDYFNEE